jgi:hypothetical protein
MKCSNALEERVRRGLIRALYAQGLISEAVFRALLGG